MYKINIPIYKKNTGSADNGNIILTHSVKTKEEGIKVRDRLNSIFARDQELDMSEDDYDFLNQIIDWQGYMIKEAYLTYSQEITI